MYDGLSADSFTTCEDCGSQELDLHWFRNHSAVECCDCGWGVTGLGRPQ